MADKPIDSPEYAKALGVLAEVLPEGVDPATIWSALQEAGMTIMPSEGPPAGDILAGAPPGLPEEAALSGAPADGEPQGTDDEMNIGNGPPTDDLVRRALKVSMSEQKPKA